MLGRLFHQTFFLRAVSVLAKAAQRLYPIYRSPATDHADWRPPGNHRQKLENLRNGARQLELTPRLDECDNAADNRSQHHGRESRLAHPDDDIPHNTPS